MAHPRFPGATDPIVLEVLGSLLVTAQARRVLQLGTYIGYSSLFIADVLAHVSPAGTLVTVEPDDSAHALAREFARGARIDNITFIDGYSTDDAVSKRLQQLGPFDLIYVDSSHAYAETLQELDRIFDARAPWLAERGLLALHDAADSARQYDPTGQGGVRRAVEEWVLARSGAYRWFVFERPLFATACGLALVSRA